MSEPHLLPDVVWHVEGQLLEASNVALRLAASPVTDETEPADAVPRAVYKPVAGERPLADFPAATLAHREVAAYLVSHYAGWTCVPETRWYEGEFGGGSLQRWVGPIQPEEQELVELLTPTEFTERARWHGIAAFEADEGPLVLAHADDPRLRPIAALDVVLNNADRKGSHLIEADRALFAIDNGLSFHVEDKLRTVLWGWAGEPLGEAVTAGLEALQDDTDALDDALKPHLTSAEIEALHTRVDALREAGTFPEPPQERYGLPWPPV